MKFSKLIRIIHSILFLSAVYSQTLNDIQKMRGDYEKMLNSENQNLREINSKPLDDVEFYNYPENVIIPPFRELTKNENKYFGYNYFARNDTISFWENLPIPTNYKLAPGDEIILSIWGATQLRKSYVITRDGNIYDEAVGLLTLNDKNLIDAKNYLIQQFGRVYATLNGVNPSAYLDVSIGKLRLINVNFVGQLNYPGVYSIHPFSNLVTALIQAGGIDTTGSLRNISIKRGSKTFAKIDMYDYLINGSSEFDLSLQDQDVVVIPGRISFVEVDSSVLNPGIYEAVEGESVHDIISYAGGLNHKASKMVSVERNNRFENSEKPQSFYVDIEKSKGFSVFSGDKIVVLPTFNSIPKIDILGQVKSPGQYNYFDEMTLKDLLDLSSGFEDEAFLKTVYLDQAEIIRRDQNSNYENVIDFNVKEVISGDFDIALESFDKVVIHENQNFIEKKPIYISGEVNIPGSYPLISDNETLESIIIRAGGFTRKKKKKGVSIFRDSKYFDFQETNQKAITSTQNNTLELKNTFEKSSMIRVAWENQNISLLPGDSIIVKEKTSTVFVTGSVYNPGVIEYKKGKSTNYYLNRAGGITEIGNRRGVVVILPNGMVSPKLWYNNPRVIEGSIVYVNEKSADEPFDLTQFATNWTSIISSMVTAIVLSQQINN